MTHLAGGFRSINLLSSPRRTKESGGRKENTDNLLTLTRQEKDAAESCRSVKVMSDDEAPADGGGRSYRILKKVPD